MAGCWWGQGLFVVLQVTARQTEQAAGSTCQCVHTLGWVAGTMIITTLFSCGLTCAHVLSPITADVCPKTLCRMLHACMPGRNHKPILHVSSEPHNNKCTRFVCSTTVDDNNNISNFVPGWEADVRMPSSKHSQSNCPPPCTHQAV